MPKNNFMKKYLFILLSILTINVSAQSVLISDSGSVTFYSYAPLEDIKATSSQLNGVINTVNGEIAFMIPMRSFHFAKALMQEHFNEKYIESEKYPQSTFKGKINEKVDFSKPATVNITASGKLTLHGREKEITEKADIIFCIK